MRTVSFQREQHVPKPLRQRVVQYSELFQSRASAFDEHGILQDLTENLKREVLLHVNHDVVTTVTLFRTADPSLVLHMLSVLVPAFALTDEIVVQVCELGRDRLAGPWQGQGSPCFVVIWPCNRCSPRLRRVIDDRRLMCACACVCVCVYLFTAR